MTDSATTCTVHKPRSTPTRVFILAHGAGAGQRSPFMSRIARAMAEHGIVTVTFDFPYMAARRKVPDRAAVLEAAWREVIAAVRTNGEIPALPLFIGGKSMGGRIASHVAAEGVDGLRGLIFLGYPLHPPGKPEQRRDAHLPAIQEPMLFVQGERDAFGTAEEIRGLLPRLNDAVTLHVVSGGDHSFKTPRGGATPDAVMGDVVSAVSRWTDACCG